MHAYMAEINLGINGESCSESRIADGIDVISGRLDDQHFSKGSLMYCIGNGWLALGEHERAVDAYSSAFELLVEPEDSKLAAQCCKNLGAALEKLNKDNEAHTYYQKALDLDPSLAEAHLALARWYMRCNVELGRALRHFDAIVWPVRADERSRVVVGWRADILFRLGRSTEAFRDIRALLGNAEENAWIWPWCARLVATYGKASVDSARDSAEFWDRFLDRYTDQPFAYSEKLLCIWFIQANGGETAWDYEQFRDAVAEAEGLGAQDPAYLWDRAGHWAQDEENWPEAEYCYRKAYELSPDEYGYCLGTALNFLDRYEEALPILLDQATTHLPDAMSWFQVAMAYEKTGKTEECIRAYKRALELDEDYDLAWFNLGGVYWNSQCTAEALATWGEAIRRFPEHPLTWKLLEEFSDQLGSRS